MCHMSSRLGKNIYLPEILLIKAEGMLISAVVPIMSIYQLPHGQYGYKAHVINLPQDITTLATSLPCLPKDLDILIVRKEGGENTHHDFRVRWSVVLHALQWLKQHNKYYRNIKINLEALSQLPVDGNMTGLASVEDNSVQNGDEEKPGDDKDSHDGATFVPIAARKNTEKESVRKTITERQSSGTQEGGHTMAVKR